ncbi:hypothetical protein QB910_000009 [Dabrowskivirus KKP3916]|uniref:Uncharacterized protein n=1 Tax=Alicyclobacillus phage KKP_3916 TaxID=3040651 RepID=A0AAT9V7G4_9CAUD|nr:hypothetical protein QB910_000009 [Alicyclobacillus phage KKP 3916]
MGSVKIDIHKAEHQYHRVTFSDTECIKGLIRFRSKLDPYQDIKVNRNEDQAGDIRDFNQELVVLYLDLDNLIKETKLTYKHMNLLKKLMAGWTEADIAEELGVTEEAVIQQFDTIANNIKKTNDIKWKYDYMYLNYLKAPWSYKTCKTCGVVKPLTSEFFSPDKKNKDGFRTQCKACR